MSMYNYCDDTVHYQRRKCSTSPAAGVQPERYIHKNIPDAFSISVLSDCICHLKKLINHLALAVVIMAEAVCLLKIFSEKIHSENGQFGFGVLVQFRTKAVHIRSDKANGAYERIVNYQLIIVTKIRFRIDTILYM